MSRLATDPAEIERLRRGSHWRLAVREIPLLRVIGLTFLSFGVFLNNRYFLGETSLQSWARTTVVLAVYGALAWLLTSFFYRRGRDLTVFFLIVDVLVWTYVIYVSGAERSWLFFIVLIRVADQTQTNFRRCLAFALFGTLSYAGMLAWVQVVDGRPLPVSVVAVKLLFVGLAGIYIALSAKTAERRRAQAASAIRMARDSIRQLEENSRELRDARGRAEEASAAKSEFLANMSHEMRTPLHGVIGMLQLAIDDEESPRRMRQLEMARRSAESLLATIDDILDFSKIEARKLELEPVYFSMRNLLFETMKPLGVTAAAKDLVLALGVAPDVPDNVWGDPVRIRQILVNLVGNAIKFTDSGEIAVRVAAAEDAIRFEVRDTGMGIPEDKRQAIFEPFEQGDTSSTRRAGGTGLGLSIVSRLVEAMGGSIDVRSEPGRGSTFSFVLGLQSDAIGSAPRHAAWETALAGKNVAVIDPNATSRTFIVEMLSTRDMIVSAFATPSEMPRKQYACAVTADEYTEVAPAIVITSPLEHISDDRLRVTRPVTERELIDAVGAALGLVRSPVVRASGGGFRRPDAMRVLVAEDNLINQEFAAEAVRRLGHDVKLAQDGETALAMMRREIFDLVLMDVQMPKLDGLHATQLYRETEPSSIHTPIIALTAHTSREDRQRCLEAGMDAVLTKPIDLKQLEQVVRSVTGSDPIIDAVGGNRKLLARVGDAFAKQTPEILKAMRLSIERKDGPSLFKEAHTMKGAVSNFGADPSVDLSLMIETAAMEKDFARAAALVGRLEAAVIALERRITAAMTE
ncbi:MAG TPA: ATP-binding protein [Thermoanaerobaculia bacterium]|nr:ATP-binding protein [Thermoanaerobaculia bacterium]